MRKPKPQTNLYRAVAAAEGDVALTRLLERHGVSVDELTSLFEGLPADLRSELADSGAFGAPLVHWRREQKAIAVALEFVERVAQIAGSPRPKSETWQDAAYRVAAVKALSAAINAGLKRTVSLHVSHDLRSFKPAPRDLMGAAWLQLAEAARALVLQKPVKKCERRGCGVEFTPKRSTAKFCSQRCRLLVHLSK